MQECKLDINFKQMKYIIILLSFVFLISCRTKFSYPIKGNLDYTTTFQPNSYIVMYDSMLNRLDTLTYKEGSSGFDHHTLDESVEYKMYEFSTKPDSTGAQNLIITCSASGKGRSLRIRCNFSDIDLIVYSEPFEIGMDDQHDTRKLQTYHEYTVRGKVYKTVFESMAGNENSDYIHVFYSLYDGVIKMDMMNQGTHKVFEIDESHIVH